MKRYLLIALVAVAGLANFNMSEARALGVVTSKEVSSTDALADSETTEAETSDFTESSFGGVSFYEPKFGTAATAATSSTSSSSTSSATSTFGSSSSFGNFGDKKVSLKFGETSNQSGSSTPSSDSTS